MSAYPGGHAVFLAVAIGTHALVGYTLGAVLLDAPRTGLLGGLAPDVDFLFPAALTWPLVHRGLTHSLLALVCLSILAAAWARQRPLVGRRERRSAANLDWRVAAALCVGYLSHLVIDATSPLGVPLAYPLASTRASVPLGGHSPTATAALWTGCLVLLWYRQGRRGSGAPIR